jgi:hypothetical protein
MARNVRPDCLGIHNQQPDFSGGQPREIDNTHATSFAGTGARPANLPAATAIGNDISSFRICSQPREKLQPFVLRSELVCVGRKGRCFRTRVHASTIRHRRTAGLGVPVKQSALLREGREQNRAISVPNKAPAQELIAQAAIYSIAINSSTAPKPTPSWRQWRLVTARTCHCATETFDFSGTRYGRASGRFSRWGGSRQLGR